MSYRPPPPIKPSSVEYWAEQRPDERALCEGSRSLTWLQWNIAADRVAEVLHQRAEIGPSDRVAVCMQNRLEWFVLQAAINKLGASLVPVSYRLTTAEVHYIVADCGARAFAFDAEDVEAMARVWTDQPPSDVPSQVACVLSVMRSPRPEVIALAEISAKGPAIPRYAQHAPRSIVYTSGTTGRPRGVVTARTASGTAPALRGGASGTAPSGTPPPRAERPPPGALPVVRNLLGAPLNHAAGQASARGTHAVGGCVYIMPRFDPEEALRIISREQITTTFLVPTMLNRIVNLPAETRAQYDVSSVKMIATGASPCPQSVKEQVIAYFGEHCLYESYGSTEVGLITRMLPGDHLKKPGSCGQLLENVTVRVVDGEGLEVAPGGIGEILVRTPVMIERYLNNPAAPEELVDGFFASGDVGRFDEDGYLFILDRKKDMIIAGGVNIYPAEIEDALRRHPAVLDAAAFGVPHADLGEEVRAVVERVDGQAVSESDLLAFVGDQLAGYKRPRTIAFLSEIPRNAAGKVLKAQLRAPYWQGKDKLV